jgi:hypothetical protein
MPRDSGSLAEQILRLVRDYACIEKIGTQAREQAELHFDVRSVVAKHLSTYAALS